MITDLLNNLLYLSFASPWFLLALLGLPALWLFLRVTPPPPKQVSFPAIMLLTGIFNKNQSSDKAPWWLIALRLSLMTLLILAFAHPRIHQDQAIPGQGPVILMIENDWASGQSWPHITQTANTIIQDAGRSEREIYLALPHQFDENGKAILEGPIPAQTAQNYLQQLEPQSSIGDYQSLISSLNQLDLDQRPSIVWLNSGIASDDSLAFEQQLTRLGTVHLYQPEGYDLPVSIAIKKDSLAEPSGIQFFATRTQPTNNIATDPTRIAREVVLSIKAQDGRILGQQLIQFGEDEFSKALPLNLPKNLVSEIASVSVEGQSHAAGLFLLDNRWRNTEIGIIQPEGENGLPLLSESYYLDKASSDLGNISIAPLSMLLRMKIGVMMMPDTVVLSGEETEQLSNWLNQGGVLIRFAGRNLAHNVGKDNLLPVALRHGGRALNGMLQWEKPASLKSFNPDSPLAGLSIPEDVIIKQQVLAETNANMTKTSWAQLEDGTSLISGHKQGQGWLVLFHTTANAEWSNLALSGIFPKILERLSRLSFLTNQGNVTNPDDSFLPYNPLKIINGKGQLMPPTETLTGLNLQEPLAITPTTPPGLYGGQGYNLALNLAPHLKEMTRYTPSSSAIQKLKKDIAESFDLQPLLLGLAFMLLIIDGISSLALRGQLPQLGQFTNRAAIFFIALLMSNWLITSPTLAQDQDDDSIIDTIVRPLITPQTTNFDNSTGLAYVVTGNSKVDKISHEGLAGLAFILNQRTAIEASNPVGINLKDSELAFYPLIYWPITESQRNLTQTEIDNVNSYLSFGGTILFDSRSPEHSYAAMMGHLQRLTTGIQIPALVPVENDHVLTKSFYLLQDFPGRWQGGNLWVEPIQAGTADGVSRVMVGQNDWAGAWAMDEYGRPRFPVTPGGEGQREMAYRFGVNLMMYMLTGNYKKDQVHIPAILERLGQ